MANMANMANIAQQQQLTRRPATQPERINTMTDTTTATGDALHLTTTATHS